MEPLLGLWIPAASRGHAVQCRVERPMTAMRLEHHEIAALHGAATDPTEDILQAPHPTTHERTQHRFCLRIKRFPEALRHGQDDMSVDDTFMEHLAHLADPVVDVDFGAPSAQ